MRSMFNWKSPIFFLIILFSFICSLAWSQPVLYLNKVRLEGLTTLSENDLVKELNLPAKQIYEPELRTIIKEKLQSILTRKGYYFATIAQKDIVPVDNIKINLVFTIEEGFKGNLEAVRFSGNRYFSTDTIIRLLALKAGRELTLTRLPGIMNNILSLYTSRGYLFTEVALDSLITEENRLFAVIQIKEGPLFKSEKYLFSGNKVTKSNTLLRISGLNQVSQITPEILSQAEENVLRKAYIRTCSIVPLNANTLGFAIEESRMTKIEGVLGVTNDPASNKRNLNGFVNLQFLNLWGTDRSIGLHWKSLSATYRLLELAYHESGWMRYPIEGDILFQRTQQDSAWVRIKAEFSAYYGFIAHKLGTNLYSETLYPDNPDTTLAVKTRYYNGSLFWEYSKTDYAPNPTTGSRFKVKSGLLFKQTSAETKSIPINELDAATYFPLAKQLVLALGLHYREISDKNAMLYEQYKLGGFNSLRGYVEDAFSSWRIGWSNSELRYIMSRDSRLFLLFDNGFLQTTPDKIKADLMGLGMGISVQSRVGLISVSYTLSISNKEIAEPGNGMLHIGLLSSF